jgi:hypothetical protein
MRRTSKPWLAASLLLLLCAAPSLGAQETAPAEETPAPRRTIAADGSVEIRTPEGTVRRIPPADPAAGEGLDAALLTPADLGLLDPSVKSQRLEALREYYAYRAQGYRHRQKTFEWQLFSSKVIFVSVLTVVFAGIYFAAVQFHVGLSRKGRARQADVVTEIDASLKGIRVSSPVLGVLILTLSLVFFYLYLAYVYPIHETF